MYSKQILATLAVAVGAVSAATTTTNCTATTFTINSQADFDAYADCTTLSGDVAIGTSTDSQIDLSGPTKIDGDLTLLNNNVITTLKSSSLVTITGEFHLQNLTYLSTLSFPSLTTTGDIKWMSLTAIDVLTFTAGVKTAESVVISDTFLSSLDGIDVESASTIDINNNRRLVTYTSALSNLSDYLNINANGLNLDVSFPNLIWITNMTISNVSSFSCPSLATVNGSMRFDSNYITSFSAPNLTELSTGDLSFVSNSDLTNISIPGLTSVGGGFQIANNTALSKIDGFDSLKTVGGAIKLRGNFTEVEFPDLNDVKGAFDIVSTSSINDSCTVFAKLAPSSQGGGGQIQGTYNCESDIANANSDTSTTTSSGSGSSSSSSGSSNTSSPANTMSVSGMAILGLAGVAGFAQLL